MYLNNLDAVKYTTKSAVKSRLSIDFKIIPYKKEIWIIFNLNNFVLLAVSVYSPNIKFLYVMTILKAVWIST